MCRELAATKTKQKKGTVTAKALQRKPVVKHSWTVRETITEKAATEEEFHGEGSISEREPETTGENDADEDHELLVQSEVQQPEGNQQQQLEGLDSEAVVGNAPPMLRKRWVVGRSRRAQATGVSTNNTVAEPPAATLLAEPEASSTLQRPVIAHQAFHDPKHLSTVGQLTQPEEPTQKRWSATKKRRTGTAVGASSVGISEKPVCNQPDKDKEEECARRPLEWMPELLDLRVRDLYWALDLRNSVLQEGCAFGASDVRHVDKQCLHGLLPSLHNQLLELDRSPTELHTWLKERLQGEDANWVGRYFEALIIFAFQHLAQSKCRIILENHQIFRHPGDQSVR